MFSLRRAILPPALLSFALLQAVNAFAAAEDAPEWYIQTQAEQARHATATFEQRLFADGLTRLYAPRGYKPLWEESGRFEQLLDELEKIADDGLNPENYGLAELRDLSVPHEATAQQRACRDVFATQTYLLALTHLAQGQLDSAAVEPRWQFDALPRSSNRNIEEALRVAEAGLTDDVSKAFTQARPALPLYGKLRHAYIALRARIAHGGGWPAIPAGESLRPGSYDARVPLLRQRLELNNATANGHDAPTASPGAPADNPIYDAALVEAVKRFQRGHYLEADGIVGKATLAELNIPINVRLDQLRINLERARWLAREMEPQMVLVDIAGARVFYYQNGAPVWQSRAQVGTPARATPLIKSHITHFTFNPTWTVPPTILRKDKLPRIRQDIDYLRRNNYRVLDSNGNELDPASVDWNRPGAIMLRQNSGPGNALGRVAIRFPNPHAVYLHDTPSQRLFERGQRTFSSGCVRVEKALDLVGQLIHDAGDLDDAAIQRILESGRMNNVRLMHPVPVLMLYWTADMDDGGQVRFRPDIYRHDGRLLKALASLPPLAPAHGCVAIQRHPI